MGKGRPRMMGYNPFQESALALQSPHAMKRLKDRGSKNEVESEGRLDQTAVVAAGTSKVQLDMLHYAAALLHTASA